MPGGVARANATCHVSICRVQGSRTQALCGRSWRVWVEPTFKFIGFDKAEYHIIRRTIMPAAVLSAFLAFTFITAFTPGPNNILALSCGSRNGFRNSAPVISGICAGFFCVMVLCGVAALSLSTISEQFIAIMKYVGCLYIVWLAWKVARARTGADGDAGTEVGFTGGFVLQFVNIKIIIYGIAAFSGFVLPYYDSFPAVFAFMLILSAIGSAGIVVWALAGSALQGFFRRYERTANAVMGIMLLGCAASLLS